MSIAYCYYCLNREFSEECTCPDSRVVYGEGRVNYLQGYRDASEGKPEDV